MSDSERSYQDELSDEMDAGGCTEAWETLSEQRDDSASRRGFLGHVAATLGIAAGGTTLATETVSAHDGSHDGDVNVETTPLRGRERGQLLKRANSSEDVAFAADVLGEKPSVGQAFEYNISGVTGRTVVFGSLRQDGTTIKYTESEGETDVSGSMPVGNGVRSVDASNSAVHDIGTDAVEEAATGAGVEQRVSTDKYQTLETETAVLVREIKRGDRFDLFVPVVSQNEVVSRAVVQGTGMLSDPDSVEVLAGNKQAGTNNHIGCGPTGTICTNYCIALCTPLIGLAAAACTAKCAGTIAGIPISPGCGAICGAVAAGTCTQTCKNLVH